jgi:hypothetical protein
MNPSTEVTTPAVPPEEVLRRIAEYRRMGLERKANPVIVYLEDQHACPWLGCTTKIRGIDFQLNRQGTPDKVDSWLVLWWHGPGLVGRCPGCGNYVQFGYSGKQAVEDVSGHPDALLPENWFRTALIAPQPPQ